MEQKKLLSGRTFPVKEWMRAIPSDVIDKTVQAYDMKGIAKILADTVLTDTLKSFFDHDLNVSHTAKAMYMHRNTLIYRLNKVQNMTGLNVHSFKDALVLYVLLELHQ